jgi:hypothetical protein
MDNNVPEEVTDTISLAFSNLKWEVRDSKTILIFT